jgi:hypothetical protein
MSENSIEPTNSIAIRSSPAARWIWGAIFLIGALGWGVVVYILVSIPTDAKNQLFLGLSPMRLGMITMALLLGIGELLLASIGVFDKNRLGWMIEWATANKRHYRNLVVVLSIPIFLFLFEIPLLKGLGVSIPALQRMAPFLVWSALNAIILLVGLIAFRNGIYVDEAQANKRLWIFAFALILLFLLFWLVMALTGIGFIPDRISWGKPGIPLTYDDILLAGFFALAGLGLLSIFRSRNGRAANGKLWDVVICGLIWIAAIWIWLQQPLQRNYFLPQLHPPNFEYYPYSDASFYSASAQRLLLGWGFPKYYVIHRSLYILVLSFIQAIAGLDYHKIILWQTLLLGTFPVILYLLGKELHSRFLGIFVACMAILREINSISASGVAEVSTSQLLLSDLPTALGIATLTLISVRWSKNPAARKIHPLLAGGVLAMIALIRTQALLLLPFILLLALINYWRKWKSAAIAGALICIGFALVYSPWYIRNWAVTGQAGIDQLWILTSRYGVHLDETDSTFQTGDETPAEEISKLREQVPESGPKAIVQFVTSHGLNNNVSTILALPLCLNLDNFGSTLMNCTPFWNDANQAVSIVTVVLIVLNLCLLAFGIVISWRRLGVAGLVPAVIFIGYNLSNAIARTSGKRYILPVDWIGYIYYAIGLVELSLLIARLLGARKKWIDQVAPPEPTSPQLNKPLKPASILLSGGILLLIGLALPLSEVLIPSGKAEESKTALVDQILANPNALDSGVSAQELKQFADQELSIAIKGQVLFPIYLPPPKKGSEGEQVEFYAEHQPPGSLGFFLASPQNLHQVYLPRLASPKYIPNATEVIVLGCPIPETYNQEYIEALLVVLLDSSGKVIYRSPVDKLTCPFNLKPTR